MYPSLMHRSRCRKHGEPHDSAAGRCCDGECEGLHLQLEEQEQQQRMQLDTKSPGKLIVAAGLDPKRVGCWHVGSAFILELALQRGLSFQSQLLLSSA